MPDSLWPQELQHIRLPCPSLSPEICSNSCPFSQWCHSVTVSSAAPFSSFPQSFPTSGSFPMSWLFASSGQSIGASASVLPMNIQGWFPLGWLVWSPHSPRDSPESSPGPQLESINSSALGLLYGPTLTSIHNYLKKHSFDYTESKEISEKHLSVSLTTLKPLTVKIMTNYRKLSERWEYQTICLSRNPYVSQEAAVRTLYETTDWFKIEKGVGTGLFAVTLFV